MLIIIMVFRLIGVCVCVCVYVLIKGSHYADMDTNIRVVVVALVANFI